MRDDLAKYIMVDADKVIKHLYEFDNKKSYFFKKPYRDGVVKASDVFNLAGIPLDFQKIVFKLPLFPALPLLKNEATDFITNYPFLYTVSSSNGKRLFCS